jgi:hypothetical protein
MDKGLKTWKKEIVVDGTPEQVHSIFLEDVWWQGGFPSWVLLRTYEIHPQEDRAGTGGVRQVPCFLQEKILNAEFGSYVEYTVERKVWFAVSYHLGRVIFESIEDGSNKSRVIWHINYTPSGFGHIIVPLVLFILGFLCLPTLKNACAQKLKYQSKTHI